MAGSPTQKIEVCEVVSKIPFGRVTTFGYIGKLTGINPQVVGWIMSGMTQEEMKIHTWQRVVAKGGVISALKLGFKGELQIQLLAQEGVLCSDGMIVSYENVYWELGVGESETLI
jgi:methylated-DNA-protein-cysteine methyltransferase related protein